MLKEAIILAGGFGTRLKEVSGDTPKPLVEVAGRPFIQYILDQLVKAGVQHIILAVSYKSELFIDMFGSEYKGAKLSFSVESKPLGTGGAISQALALCQTGTDVLVVNGDTYVDTSLTDFYNSHVKKEALLSILLVYVSDMYRYGSIDFTGDSIKSFLEKGVGGPGYINGGVYIISKTMELSQSPHSFEADFLFLNASLAKPWPVNGYFIDIGIPDDYFRACSYFK